MTNEYALGHSTVQVRRLLFDDPSVGLLQEPFIRGADRVLNILTADISNAVQGFKLVFSAQPFSGFVSRFVRSRPEFGGYLLVARTRPGRMALSGAVQIFRDGARRGLRQGLNQGFDHWSCAVTDYACSSTHCVAKWASFVPLLRSSF
jgi:hypothetical protein